MITSGVLLIERTAMRPRCFEVEPDSHPNAWLLIKPSLTPAQLEKELSTTGWTFFFMAAPIRTTALAFDRDKAIYTALKRAIKTVKRQQCNCLQIESVTTKSFLGISYVSMSVRPRNIQKGVLFAGSPAEHEAGSPAHELDRNLLVT
jgi:hypothetical protein